VLVDEPSPSPPERARVVISPLDSWTPQLCPSGDATRCPVGCWSPCTAPR